MPSAFRGARVERGRALAHAAEVRALPAILLLCACGTGPATGAPPPEVPVAAHWPDGTRFCTSLGPSVPDEPPWRAAAVWWREALRQTVAFELHDGHDRALPNLELTIDPVAHKLAACLRSGTAEIALAGGAFAPDDLPAAIDRLAWSARLALGESVAPPVAVAAGTSAIPWVVLATDDAQLLLRDGGIVAAQKLLLEARRRDGASPFVLDALASITLLRGELAAAERIAREALGYGNRLLPTTQHRLARTMLLARASQSPDRATEHDRELATLGAVAHRERPHDPQPEFSLALADNFLGDFAASCARLTALAPRLPDQPIVAYHLGWAHLGAGQAAAAAPWFERAAARLPAGWLLLPRSIALYECGRHDELSTLLQRQRDDDSAESLALRYDVLRMQAAHALLRGDGPAARELLLATMRWLLKNPLVLAKRAGEFAETGEVLVRLGGAAELPSLLAAVQQQHTGKPVADACSYVDGLARTSAGGGPVAAEANLGGGDNAWAARLAAWRHEVRGEVADMQAELARATRLSSSPMTTALLAQALRTSARMAEAEQLGATLRAEMRTFRLREPCRHPLLGPELAFAFVVAGADQH